MNETREQKEFLRGLRDGANDQSLSLDYDFASFACHLTDEEQEAVIGRGYNAGLEVGKEMAAYGPSAPCKHLNTRPLECEIHGKDCPLTVCMDCGEEIEIEGEEK
jgi:phage anti-repressor protein